MERQGKQKSQHMQPADLVAGQLLTEQEAADYLRIHKETMANLRKAKKIQYIKLGERQIRYSYAILDQYKINAIQ